MDDVAALTVIRAGEAVGGLPAAYSVTHLLKLIDGAVRSAGLVELWVSGTVTGMRPGAKFTSFELVDYEADGSTVHAVLTVGVYARFAREMNKTLAVAGAELADGLQVALWGKLDLNPRYGRLRLLAERVDPRTTVGAAVLARDDLVGELERCGRLRAQAALAVPAVPRRIGLVSSPGAAGRADVLEVLGRSPLSLDVIEATAAMSGPGAPAEVSRAIDLLAGAGVDIILIARGGGPKSDLAPWESRPVALAITGCAVPIWTALGHATDHCLADSLAAACHPTPSAAAAALVARAEAQVRAQEQEAERTRHQRQLVASRRRARCALALAAVLVVALLVLLMAGR